MGVTEPHSRVGYRASPGRVLPALAFPPAAAWVAAQANQPGRWYPIGPDGVTTWTPFLTGLGGSRVTLIGLGAGGESLIAATEAQSARRLDVAATALVFGGALDSGNGPTVRLEVQAVAADPLDPLVAYTGGLYTGRGGAMTGTTPGWTFRPTTTSGAAVADPIAEAASFEAGILLSTLASGLLVSPGAWSSRHPGTASGAVSRPAGSDDARG